MLQGSNEDGHDYRHFPESDLPGALEAFCDQVIQENESIANDVRGGNEKAANALVGRVMKLSKGQANPKVVIGILLAKLQG